MDKLSAVFQLRKADAGRRMVYCSIDETPDHAREIFDYSTSKPHFQKWSDDQLAASDGKSYGNVREMHAKVCAGIVAEPLEFDDEHKRIGVWIKVVDDSTWEKFEAGALTGVSPGGSYAKKWPDTLKKGQMRYTAVPIEMSMVDKPCIPSATFTMVKADGAEEELPFTVAPEPEPEPWSPPSGEVKKMAGALAKMAGKPDAFKDYVAKARQLLIDTHDDEPEAISPEEQRLAAAMAKVDQGKQVESTPVAPFTAEGIRELIKALEGKPLPMLKGLYTLAWIADLLGQVQGLQDCLASESFWEGDNSALPAKAKEICRAIADLLVSATAEETAELLSGEGVEVAPEMALASAIVDYAKADVAIMEKVGARNSKTDAARIQSVHDHAMALGATCTDCNSTDAEKVAAGGEAEVEAGADTGRLQKAVGDAADKIEELLKGREADAATIGTLNSTVADLTKRLVTLEKQPMPAKGSIRAVTKEEDGGASTIAEDGSDAQGKAIAYLQRRGMPVPGLGY